MKDEYLLVTYYHDGAISDVTRVVIPDYDGHPRGATVPFTVESNQTIVSPDRADKLVVEEVDEARCRDPRLGSPEATTAAMAAKSAAEEVLGEEIYTGGCKAFHDNTFVRDYWPEHTFCVLDNTLCFIVCDGGDLASLLNVAYENYEGMNKFQESITKRGYLIYRVCHFIYGVRKLK